VSQSAEVMLAVIALATLVIAIVQVGVLVAAGVLARKLTRMVDDVEDGLRPLFAHLDAIGKDAARASSVAVAQVERVDQLVSELAVRMDETVGSVQAGLKVPGREARALLTALRAALTAVQEARRRARRADEEDPLFI
jgi:hypothetical protein